MLRIEWPNIDFAVRTHTLARTSEPTDKYRWRNENINKMKKIGCGNRSQNYQTIIMIVSCVWERHAEKAAAAAAVAAEKKWKLKVIIEWNLLFSLMAIRFVHSSVRTHCFRFILFNKNKNNCLSAQRVTRRGQYKLSQSPLSQTKRLPSSFRSIQLRQDSDFCVVVVNVTRTHSRTL